MSLDFDSVTFNLAGNGPVLNSIYNPPIYLDENGKYEIALTEFECYNMIPNIDETNNIFYYDIDNKEIAVPTGAYELNDIFNFLKLEMAQRMETLSIVANNNTGKIRIRCSKRINFDKPNSIGKLLGFTNTKVLEKNITYMSDSTAQINKLNSICVDCNIAIGSFTNGDESHLIHSFAPTVPVGFKIVENPKNLIYQPVTVKTITNIKVQILDQDLKLLNLRGELVTVRLHLRNTKKND